VTSKAIEDFQGGIRYDRYNDGQRRVELVFCRWEQGDFGCSIVNTVGSIGSQSLGIRKVMLD